jgi:ribosomal protein S24E
MLSLKEMWSPSQIRTEASNIESHLYKTTQRLMCLERQYRLKKMEYLASIEAYEERLKWVTAEMQS